MTITCFQWFDEKWLINPLESANRIIISISVFIGSTKKMLHYFSLDNLQSIKYKLKLNNVSFVDRIKTEIEIIIVDY